MARLQLLALCHWQQVEFQPEAILIQVFLLIVMAGLLQHRAIPHLYKQLPILEIILPMIADLQDVELVVKFMGRLQSMELQPQHLISECKMALEQEANIA